MDSIKDEIEEEFNFQIVKELILEINKNETEQTMLDIWSKCRNNPWNAGIIYSMIRCRTEINDNNDYNTPSAASITLEKPDA